MATGRRMPAVLLAAVFGTWLGSNPAQATVADLRVLEPRSYAWFIGDQFTRTVRVVPEAGFELDEAALPATGEMNHWLDLVDVSVARQGEAATISLTYRITNAPEEGRETQRTVPGWDLYTRQGERRVPTNISEFSFTQLPVVPRSAAEFLSAADVRDDNPPRPADWPVHFVRVVMLTLAVAVLGLYLLYCHFGAVWLARWRRPFTAALRDLRRVPSGAEGTLDTAFSRFHAAVNEAAGQVVMREDLEGFLARQPLYSPERAAIDRVFQASSAWFFAAPGEGERMDLAELVTICRRLSVLELSAP